MSKNAYIIINWIALAAVLTVNALANILPINGLTSGEVSDLYPNLFVPAGFTFGIWGFIYLLLLLHVSYSTYILAHTKRSCNDIGCVVLKINPWFWLTCALNISWLFAWHYLHVGLSVLIIIALFFTLFKIFRIISVAEKQIELGYMEHISLETPFIIYFSWIAVAVIANITALLVSTGWHPSNEVVWSCVMIAVAGIIGIIMSVIFHRPAYTAVIIWAIYGIYSNHALEYPGIAITAMTTGGICLLAAIFGFWHKKSLLFRSSVQVD